MNPVHLVHQAAIEYEDYVVALRRKLHRAPELSYREQGSAAVIKEELDRMGIPWQAAGEHGVVATIVGCHERAMVALRADMDALPLQEKNDHLAYRSAVPGVMPACGHDGHVAMLLAAAKLPVPLLPRQARDHPHAGRAVRGRAIPPLIAIAVALVALCRPINAGPPHGERLFRTARRTRAPSLSIRLRHACRFSVCVATPRAG